MATKRINLGPHEYTHTGKLYGPGVVDVPDNIYDDLTEAVQRKAVALDTGIDPNALSPVDLGVVDDEALIAEVKKRQAMKKAAAAATKTGDDNKGDNAGGNGENTDPNA